MINWMRPSGSPITTNEMDETIAYANKLGWVRIEDKKEVTETKVKRTRRTKAQMQEARNGNRSNSHESNITRDFSSWL